MWWLFNNRITRHATLRIWSKGRAYSLWVLWLSKGCEFYGCVFLHTAFKVVCWNMNLIEIRVSVTPYSESFGQSSSLTKKVWQAGLLLLLLVVGVIAGSLVMESTPSNFGVKGGKCLWWLIFCQRVSWVASNDKCGSWWDLFDGWWARHRRHGGCRNHRLGLFARDFTSRVTHGLSYQFSFS